MIILGIDPGIALTGWGAIESHHGINLIDYGCIKTSKDKDQNQRLFDLFNQLQELIKDHKPKVIAIERLFFNTNAKTAFAIGEARGVIKMCAVLNKVVLHEFTPLQIKDSIVGYGRAEKHQVQQMTKMLLKLKDIPKPDDAADAIAVALTYCFYNKNLENKK